MREFIEKLTHQFLAEAQASPSLWEDMAQMEKYMAESYSNRAFIELIQNADDAFSKRILISYNNGNLYVANDGRPFTESDITAICRSGASNKTRGETIGYRGVGFKSTTSISDTIIIYSGNCSFAFSKSIVADYLHVPVYKVPTVRVPFVVDNEFLNAKTNHDIQSIKDKGYSTIFIFRDADYYSCLTEVASINMNCLIFLKNIEKIDGDETLSPFHYNKVIVAKSIMEQEVEIVDKALCKTKSWYVLGNKHIHVVALPRYKDTFSSLSESDDNVFHCFLPTLDKTGFEFRINGDFSTDPSRKHIMMDQKTQNELNRIGSLLCDLTIQAMNSDDDWAAALIHGINSFKATNQFSARLFYCLQNSLRTKKWITDITGTNVLLSESYILQKWADDTVVRALYEISKAHSFIYETNEEKRSLLNLICDNRQNTEVFTELLESERAVKRLSVDSSLAMVFFVIRNNPNSMLNRFLNRIYVKKQDSTVMQLKDAINDYSFLKLLSKVGQEYADEATIGRIKSQFGIVDKSLSPTLSILKKKTKVIPKWQTAEQLCAELEKLAGNVVQDVSVQNVGYDILSTDPLGNKKYIEVKSLKSVGEAVIITNNEYTTAHHYGSDYYLCLVVQGSPPSVLYIRDPLHNDAHLEKRVRMWEWVFSDYQGEFRKIEI